MTAAPPAASTSHPRRVVLGVSLTIFLAALDQTIIAPALPTLGAELRDAQNLPWVVTAYLLAATAATPLYGKLSDIHGRRPMLQAAILIFVLGSVLCALAPSVLLLALARAVQGLGGGGLLVLSQTVIADVVPPKERGRYMAIISGTFAVASVAGPILGGVTAEHLHWSVVFWINLPLGAAAIVIVRRVLAGQGQRRHGHRLDLLGAILMVSASLLFLLALSWGGVRFSWGSPLILGLFGGAAAFWLAFLRHVWLAPDPFLPLSVLRDQVILRATLTAFFLMAAYIGLIVFVPVYFELVLGLPPSLAGLALVTLAVGTVSGAWLAGSLTSRVRRYKRVGVAGIGLSLAALSVLALWAGQAPLALVELLLTLAGIGIGTHFPITVVAVQNASDPAHLGVATAALNFLRSLGSAVGVAVCGAIMLGHGVAAGIEGMGEGAADPTRLVPAFRLVFAVTGLGVLLALACFLAMEERPLRSAPARA